MRYRNLAKAGVWLVMVGALLRSVPSATSATTDTPPAGAVTADVRMPRIGSQWTIRITDLNQGTTKDESRTAVLINYKGVSRFGVTNGEKVFVFDQQDHNLIAILNRGKEELVHDPEDAQFSWPLWVGKTWYPTYSESDLLAGKSWPSIQPYHAVEAFEEVTVPAGTFKAFRIRTSRGLNYYNTSVDWYAPDLGLIVKNLYYQNSIRGTNQTSTELLARPK